MGWEIPVVAGLGCLVLVLGAIGAAFYIGKAYPDPIIDSLEATIKNLEAQIAAAREQAAENAIGETEEHRAAVDVASAVAADDLERVRLSFRDDGSTPPSEPSGGAESAGGGRDV